MSTRIQLRRDTAAAWADANPTLALGEAGYDLTNNQLRIGDGERAWNALTPLDANVNLSAYATKAELNTESNTRSTADAGLDARITALENGDGGGGTGPGPGASRLIYRGTTYWTSVDPGDVWIHPDEATLFLPTLDLNGFDLAAFLDEFASAGTTFYFCEVGNKNYWVHLEATGNPQVQTWGRNVPTTLIGQKNGIRVGQEVELIIDLAHAGTFDQSRWEGVEEMLAQMKRQITALKGEVTKLRKAQT